MPRLQDEDWSDSDDDEASDVETSVQLGIPDGPLESASDHLDAAVSRIGGHPVRYILLPHACTLILIECNPISLSLRNMTVTSVNPLYTSSLGVFDFSRTAVGLSRVSKLLNADGVAPANMVSD